MAAGWSRLQVVMSTSPGEASSTKLICVPQTGQKVRVAWLLERNEVGLPLSSLKPADRTVNQATQGAPVVPRHMVQWHTLWLSAAPDASYLIAPQ